MEKINYTVRKLERQDLDTDKGFFETLENLTDSPLLEKNKAINIYEKITSQGTKIFIAITDNNQIIGTISLLLEQKFTHGGVLAGHIEEVSTKKGYEGMGVASALIKKAIEEARNNNCYKIILDCKIELMPFYEKFGFENHGNCMRINF